LVSRPHVLEHPAFEILDEAFAACVDTDARVERLWTGGIWTEGPAWRAGESCLVWSDIPNNRMLSWRLRDGTVETFRQSAAGSNGNTIDREGRLLTCEQFTRRVTRTEADGSVTVLADRYDGKRFNAPNDIVVKSDGSIWFTDPDYGSRSPHYEGKLELDGCHVYRIDPENGDLRQMTDDMVMPNGLAFSPDEQLLYAIDTGSTHRPDGPCHIRVFDVGSDNTLIGGEVFAVDEAKKFDGLRVDIEGRLWCGVSDGVRCYTPGGVAIGRVVLPERSANLTFGGPDYSRLFMCATTSLYSVQLRTMPAVKR
jgi:gluconolactonase